MLESGSQLFLDNAVPQAKTDSISVAKSSGSDNSNFSSYLDNANKKPPQAQDTERQQSTQLKKNQNITKQPKKDGEANQDKTEAAESAQTKERVKQADANDKTTELETRDSDENKQVNSGDDNPVKDKPTDFNKIVSLNSMILIADQTDDQLSAGAETKLELKEHEATLHALVAKTLKNNETIQLAQEKVNVNGNLDNLQQAMNNTLGNGAELVKTMMTDAKGINEFRDSLLKKMPTLQHDSHSNQKAESTIEEFVLEDALPLDEEKVDDFVAKIFDRLNMNKSNLDSLLTARLSGEKAQISNELIDQISTKLNTEEVNERVSLSTSLTSSVNQRSNVLNAPSQFTLNTHINQPEWGNEFSKRIQFMMNNNIQSAELRLDPPELGRINVKINMSSDQANVTFTSAHQSVRDVIETTLPRLRDLLAESGLQLGNADVGSQFQQQTKQQGDTASEGSLSGPVNPELDEITVAEDILSPKLHYSVDGMIDYFA